MRLFQLIGLVATIIVSVQAAERVCFTVKYGSCKFAAANTQSQTVEVRASDTVAICVDFDANSDFLWIQTACQFPFDMIDENGAPSLIACNQGDKRRHLWSLSGAWNAVKKGAKWVGSKAMQVAKNPAVQKAAWNMAKTYGPKLAAAGAAALLGGGRRMLLSEELTQKCLDIGVQALPDHTECYTKISQHDACLSSGSPQDPHLTELLCLCPDYIYRVLVPEAEAVCGSRN